MRSRVERQRVGTWQFVRRDFDVTGTEDCQKVEHFLEEISDKARTIVKLSLVGQLSLADMDRLEAALDHAVRSPRRPRTLGAPLRSRRPAR